MQIKITGLYPCQEEILYLLEDVCDCLRDGGGRGGRGGSSRSVWSFLEGISDTAWGLCWWVKERESQRAREVCSDDKLFPVIVFFEDFPDARGAKYLPNFH